MTFNNTHKFHILNALCLLAMLLSGCSRNNSEKILIQEVDLILQKNISNSISVNLKDNKSTSQEPSNITFSITDNRFLVISPKNNSSGIYLGTSVQKDKVYLQNSLKECRSLKNELLQGSKPVSSEGDTFCWETEKEIFVILIDELYIEENTIKIKIKYVYP